MISIQSKLFKNIAAQCPSLLISDVTQWEFKRISNGFYDLECLNDNHKEFLNLYLESDSSKIRGYYDVETDSSYLNFRLVECDTAIYFELKKTTNRTDTVFKLGYYKYLYDKNLLTKGQKRYFKKNIDSLWTIRGNNLKTLPEIDRNIKSGNNEFGVIE
ncbi:MAG: hypothetical protein L3J06_10580 [Cyclobacteriaceae bacterium]|nr:hypothetical protein [Cyclobacteriaceae bacterium]